MFYDTSSTYREAYGKFFRSETLLPDGSSSVPFFRFRSFCTFIFYLWLVFFSLVPDCTTTKRKFSLLSSIHFFAAQSTFFRVATIVFSCSSPAPTPEKSSRLRRFFVDDHLITKMPTHEKPFKRPSPRQSFYDHLRQSGRSSQVLESSFDQPTLSGPKQGLRLTACSWFPFYAEKETKK